AKLVLTGADQDAVRELLALGNRETIDEGRVIRSQRLNEPVVVFARDPEMLPRAGPVRDTQIGAGAAADDERPADVQRMHLRGREIEQSGVSGRVHASSSPLAASRASE